MKVQKHLLIHLMILAQVFKKFHYFILDFKFLCVTGDKFKIFKYKDAEIIRYVIYNSLFCLKL